MITKKPSEIKTLDNRILQSFESDSREEHLFILSLLGETAFGILLKEGDEASICTVQCREDEAYRLFELIHENRLSPIHLNDLVEDFKKEKILF